MWVNEDEVLPVLDTGLRAFGDSRCRHDDGRLRAARSLLLVSTGAAIADVENFDVLDPSRGPKLDNVALTRLHQGSRNRRYPAHLATIASAKAWVYIASVQLLVRRLA